MEFAVMHILERNVLLTGQMEAGVANTGMTSSMTLRIRLRLLLADSSRHRVLSLLPQLQLLGPRIAQLGARTVEMT